MLPTTRKQEFIGIKFRINWANQSIFSRRDSKKFDVDAFGSYIPKRLFTNPSSACCQTASHAPNFVNTRRAIRGGRLQPWRNANIFNTNHSLNETRRKKLQICTRPGCGIGCQNVTIRGGLCRRWDVVQLFSQRPLGPIRPEALRGGPGRLDSLFYVSTLHY